MANAQALAKALIRANNAAATAGPGGFGGAPPSTMGPSPTVASYGEWAGGRAGYAGATYGLPREWEAFLSGSFGPLSPMRPIPIDAPPLGDDDRGPEPRRYTYPVSWNLPHGVPGDEGLKLASFSQLRTIADTYSVARACIQTRTQEIVGLDWSIVPTAEAEKAMRGDRAARKDFDERRAKLVKFFNRPDPGKYHNLASWLGALIEDILVVDAASLYLQPTRKKGKGVLGSNLGALCLIAGDTIRPMLDMHGGTPPPPNPAFQVYNFGVPRVDLMTVLSGEDVEGMSDQLVTQYRGDQLMYMPYVARSWTPYGFPAIERALVPILSGIQRQQWQLSYYGNGSVPGLFISAGDPNASPAQLRQLQDALNAMAGDPAWKHQIIVLPKDSKIDPMRATPLADQFDEMVMSQVCMSFDVMPMELGISPRTSTSQSSGAANQMSKASEGINERKALKPLLKWLKASIFDFVIQEVCGQSDIQWMWEGLEKDEDEQTQVNLLVNEVGHGLRSIDEARVARGEQAWGLPMTSIPVFFGAAGVTPIQPPAVPEPSPMPEGEPPPPGGEGEGSPPSSTTPTPTTPTPPSPTQPPQPADGGETPAHGGARAHVAETMRASDGGSAQADKPAPPPSNKMLTSEPVEVRSALRELDLIRRRLNKGRGLDDWTPEHVPVDVFAELVATYPQGVDKAVGYARAAVKTVAHRQRRDESCAHVQQRVVDGLHELAAGVGDGTVSTIGFVDAATALMRDAIRDGLGAGADHARVPVATKQATIPAKVDGLDGQFGLYAGAVPQAYEHGFGLVTLGAADDPDNIAIRWHAKPDACVLCGARDGQLFTVGTLPGWPGDGGFGKNATVCLGGPNCRCSLEYVHVTPDEMARVLGEQVPRSDASITSQTVQANASVTRDAHVAVAREAIHTGDPQMLDAVLDRIAESKAEAQRPFLMGLLQDILAALTRGAAALRTWLTTKGASNPADPNPVDAEHVAALMRANFPDDALGWVKDARWIGPVAIPQDRIDDDDMDSWAATRDKARVKHFARRINGGDPPHPIIAVQEPGDTNIKVVDGHHRTLAYRKAGKPVPAYVGFVDADGGPWDETHAYQVHQGDHPANKASEHGHHVPGTPPKYSHGWVLRPESTASWTKVAGTDITENLDADSLAPASATVGKAEQMRTILDHQGFGGLPHVTDTKGLDDVVASGGQELFRGVASPDHAEQFRTGPLHISGQGEGDSSFGQGIYAGGIGVAQMFAGGDGVMRMALSPDARIVTQEDLRTERSQRSPKWTDAQRSLFFDDGRLAAALGYDAISYGPNPDPSERNYVVLNRTALTVQSGDSSIAAAVRRAHAKESVVSLRRWSRAAAKQDLRSKQKDELLALADLLQVEHGLAGVGELRAALLDALWPPANQVHQGDHPANKRDVSGEVRIPRGMPGGGRWVKVTDWVHVGGHGVGDTVHHPEHGTGVVHEVGKTTTRVDFGGGNRLSFDRKTKAGAGEHFAQRGEKPATQGQLPVGRLDHQIANAESRVQVTRERLARAQDAFDAASRDPKVESLRGFFPLGTGGSGGGRRGSTDAQLRRYVEARKARDAAQSQHVRAESQLRELTARRGAVGKYGRDTVSVGDAIKVKGTWWRVQKANDKTVQIDAGPGMEVKYRWDQVTDHRRVTVTPAPPSAVPRPKVEPTEPAKKATAATLTHDPIVQSKLAEFTAHATYRRDKIKRIEARIKRGGLTSRELQTSERSLEKFRKELASAEGAIAHLKAAPPKTRPAGYARGVDRTHEHGLAQAVMDRLTDASGAQWRWSSFRDFTEGDAAAATLNEHLGFDGLPQSVTGPAFAKLVKDGTIGVVIYRGDTPAFSPEVKQLHRSAADIQRQFREGHYRVGIGTFGNGTYAAVSRKHASAPEYAKNGAVAKYGLRSDAHIVTWDDIKIEYSAYMNHPDVKVGSPEWDLYSDVGRFAAARGYDAISIDAGQAPGFGNVAAGDQYLILNRTAVIAEVPRGA